MMFSLLESLKVNLIRWIRDYFSGMREHRLPAESTRAQRGQFGEDLAAEYCQRELGYRVIIRNWSCKKDEIDLICQDGEVLVFIEVRARSENALVSGYYSVDRHKKKILRRVFRNYLRRLKEPPKHFRFDIIDVSICKKGKGDVRHYSNVSLFNKHFSVQRTSL
ncbi:MAG: putative endonuclease [Lentimonas sp.]|jgi:putative endonuclease